NAASSTRRVWSKHEGVVRKLVGDLSGAWKVLRQDATDLAHAILGARDEHAVAKRGFHRAAHRLPRRLTDLTVNAVVGYDLHATIGEEHVHEHAAVVLGVPGARQREHFEGAFVWRQTLHHPTQRQRC